MKKLKKIKLEKEVIAELSKKEANDLKGGGVNFLTLSTVAGWTMNSGCSYGGGCDTDNCPIYA